MVLSTNIDPTLPCTMKDHKCNMKVEEEQRTGALTISTELLASILAEDPTSVLLVDCRHPSDHKKNNIITSINVHVTNPHLSPMDIENQIITDYPSKILFRQREFCKIILYDETCNTINLMKNEHIEIPQKHFSLYLLLKSLREENLTKDISILEGGFENFVSLFPAFCTVGPSETENQVTIINPLRLHKNANIEEHLTNIENPKAILKKGAIISIQSLEVLKKMSKAHSMSLMERVQIAHMRLFKSLTRKVDCELPSMIFPHLYLGNLQNSVNKTQLQQLGIGHILNAAKECKNHFKDEFTYMKISLIDDENEDVLSYFDEGFRFIEDAKKQKSRVLVHCFMGMSRSAAIVIAYAMKYKNWSLKRAYQHVRKHRPIIDLNMGFMYQLIEYERKLFGVSSIPSSCSPKR